MNRTFAGRLGFLFVIVWMLGTFASFRNREIWELLEGSGLDAQVSFRTYSWFIFGLIATYAVYFGYIRIDLLLTGPLFWYSLFTAIAVASAAYSPAPEITAFYAFQLAIALLLACSVWAGGDTPYVFVVTYVGINWILVILGSSGLNFGQEWIAPPREIYFWFGGGDTEAWRFTSAFGHPSIISVVAAMGAVGMLSRLGTRPVLGDTLVLMWLVITVLLTVSRTGIAGMLLGFIVVAWGRGKLLQTFILGLLVLLYFVIFPSTYLGLGDFFSRGQTEEEIQSFTGRVELYGLVFDRIKEFDTLQFMFGNGFRSLRAELLDGETWGMGISHAHNMLMEAFLSLGLIGAMVSALCLLSFFALAVGAAFHPLYRELGRDGSDLEAMAVFCPIAAFCALDSGIAMNLNPFVITFILFSARLNELHLFLQKTARRVLS